MVFNVKTTRLPAHDQPRNLQIILKKTLTHSQITVKNIHIRYEDELSLDDGVTVPRPLSAGVTLRELVVQTVDEHWTPTYVQEAGGGKGGDR